MLVVLFSLCLFGFAYWFVQTKSKQVEQQHDLRLQKFMKDLQSEDSSVELVKRIKKNPHAEDPPES